MIRGSSSSVVGTAQLVTADGFERSQSSWKRASTGGMETAPMATSLPPQAMRPPPQEAGSALRCPRCDSTNTKFCYYNNYSRAQPRHFCRACRRHWTNGGTLRNVPVGGRRKAKRTKSGTAGNRPPSAPNSAADDGSAGFAAAVGQPSSLQAPVLPPPDFGHLLRAPPPLPGYTNTGDDIGSSFLSALLPLPPPTHFESGLLTSALAVGDDDRGYTRAPSSLFGPPQLISFPTPEDIIAGGVIEDAISMAAPWVSLPPPSSCGSCPGGDTAVLQEPCSPSSCFWGSCWDDLTGVLFPDPTHAPPPPLLPPPKQDLQLSR